MSGKSVSLLTIKSLTALSQVCSSRNSCDAIKTLNLLKNLSTATERLDLRNPHGHDVDTSVQSDQNYSGFYTEHSSIDFKQKSNEQGFRERPTNSYGNIPVGQNGNFSGFTGQNFGDFQHSSPGDRRESSGTYGKSFRGGQQNNASGQNGDFTVYYVQTDRDLKQKSSVVYGESSRVSEPNSYQFNQNHGEVYMESARNEYQNNTFQQNGSFWYDGNQNGQLQQYLNGAQANASRSGQHSLNGVFGGNAYMQKQDGSIQERPREGGKNFMQNTGQYRQTPNSHYTGNFGIYQDSANVYQQNLNVEQYRWEPSQREYQHNGGQYQSNSSSIHNGMAASDISTNINPEGKPAVASESSQNKGTPEELEAFLKEGKVKEAVEVLGLLEKQCIPVDLPQFLHLMQACGEAKSLEEAKATHEHVVRLLSPLDVSAYNSILKMYSECGSMHDAFNVFDNMGERNLTSWDTMIRGLAKNGLGEDAVDLFSHFKQAGLKPDDQIFIGVFFACSVLGDVNEGILHFQSMYKDYGIVPSMKHYVSIVDMLGSTGYLDEALEFIEKMPMEPSVDVWETLMNLCRIHGNLELGDRCAQIVEQLDASHLDEKSKAGLVPVKASDLAKENDKKKLASQNLLEVRSRVHEYRAGDTSHPETDKIYAQIRCLKAHMKEAGYVPETRFVLHDIDQEGKEEALLAHSERLAVSQGLLTSPARAPIRIIKNLRVCGDCHTALKIISKIVGRQLIIRDAKRFHHFKDGLCSCRDYW